MDDIKKYAEEAEKRWGNTEVYTQSQERVKKLGMVGMLHIAKELDSLLKELTKNMGKGPASEEVQKLIGAQYEHLKNFYEPNLVMYRALGDMYVGDARFRAFFDKYQIGLAEFVRDAIHIYCNSAKESSRQN